MTFYTYMIRTYKNECSNRGDLANDMAWNKDNFPRNKSGKAKEWHEIILNYLFCHNACSECIETFEECWEEYLALEKNRRRKPPMVTGTARKALSQSSELEAPVVTEKTAAVAYEAGECN